MRFHSTLLLLVFAGFYLSSYSTGPANGGVDGTSSGLSGSRQCSGCHNGGSFGTKTTFALLDAQGQAQASYRPGETYKLRVDIATATTPGGYGFQVLVIDGQKASAGTYGTAPANAQVSTFGGRNYFEHRRRLTSGTIDIDWTAPAKGTGALNVYAVGNAVNGNGGTSGDQPDEAIVTLTESTASGSHDRVWPAGITVAQSAGSITLHGDGFGEGPYTVRLIDLEGRMLRSTVLAKADLTMSGLQAGAHVLQLEGEEGLLAARIVVVLP